MIEYCPGWQWAFSWILYLGFAFCFMVAFGMGANDCANSYATVVGARVLKLWQAYILATIFEISGAGLLGYKVTSTMTTSVVDVNIYDVYTNNTWNNGTCPVFNSTCYDSDQCDIYTEGSFAIGELAALISTSCWLLFATVLRLPVSTTQSAVGATVGFSMVLKGPDGIHWRTIVGIVISWVSSPLLAGLMAVAFYIIVKYTVLKRDNQFEASLTMMPFFYFFALSINIFAVTYDGSKYLYFNLLTWYECVAISAGIGIAVALFAQFYGRHWIKKRVLGLQQDQRLSAQIRASESKRNSLSTEAYQDPDEVLVHDNSPKSKERRSSIDSVVILSASDLALNSKHLESVNCCSVDFLKSQFSEIKSQSIDEISNQSPTISKSSTSNLLKRFSVETLTRLKVFKHPIQEDPLATEVFHYLQIMSACFLSFSHGSNDTANCVGSLVGIWLIFTKEYVGVDSSNDTSLVYLILFGAVSMVIGLWILGHKVIKTMGNSLTEVTAPSGFCMELGTAFTVLFASKLGIPISTTHCAVGAIVAVGWFKSHEGGVSWRLFKNIAAAWLVTLPIAALVSALLTYLFGFTL